MSTWQDLQNNPRLKKIYDTRLKITKAVREFFWLRDFVEAETPVAVRYASQEPYLQPVNIDVKHPNGKSYPMYLRTSPEYALKKLLAAGYSNIFEIGKCFRNVEDFGGSHNPEFTMLEWYRSPGMLGEIMDDTEALFQFVCKKIHCKELQFNNKKISVNGVWERVTMKALWQKYFDTNLDECLELEPIQQLAKSKGFSFTPEDAYEDIFYKLFLNVIEPELGKDRPTFVYDYPARLCSLSRLCDHDSRYAERFELYIGGLELANAFGELTDAVKQEKNLEADKKLREKLGKPTWPVDPEFIAALKSGIGRELSPMQGGLSALPAEALAKAGGIALGLDRMVVLCTGAQDINEVIFYSLKDQHSNN